MKKRVLLEGAELEAYRQKQREEREARDAEVLAVIAEEEELIEDRVEFVPGEFLGTWNVALCANRVFSCAVAMDHDLMVEESRPSQYFPAVARSRVNPMYPYNDTKVGAGRLMRLLWLLIFRIPSCTTAGMGRVWRNYQPE